MFKQRHLNFNVCRVTNYLAKFIHINKKTTQGEQENFFANLIMFFPHFGISTSAFSKPQGDETPASANEK